VYETHPYNMFSWVISRRYKILYVPSILNAFIQYDDYYKLLDYFMYKDQFV